MASNNLAAKERNLCACAVIWFEKHDYQKMTYWFSGIFSDGGDEVMASLLHEVSGKGWRIDYPFNGFGIQFTANAKRNKLHRVYRRDERVQRRFCVAATVLQSFYHCAMLFRLKTEQPDFSNSPQCAFAPGKEAWKQDGNFFTPEELRRIDEADDLAVYQPLDPVLSAD